MATLLSIVSQTTSRYRLRISSAAKTHLTLLLARSELTSANNRIYEQLPEEVRKRHQPLRYAYASLWDTLLKNAQQAGQLREDIKIVPLRQFLLGGRAELDCRMAEPGTLFD